MKLPAYYTRSRNKIPLLQAFFTRRSGILFRDAGANVLTDQ